MNGTLDLHFDMAAMVIMVIILIMLSARKNIPIKRSYVYIFMCVVQVLVIICSMCLQTRLYIDSDTDRLCYVFSDLYFTLDYSCALIFMYYLVLLSGKSMRGNIRARVLFILPFIPYAFLVVDNLINHNLYTIVHGYGFVGTKRLAALSAVALYAMLFGIFYAIRYIETVSYGRLIAIALGSVGVVAGIAVQYRMGGVFFINFVVAVAILLLYELAQNPANILDVNTQVLNRNVMDELLKMDIEDRKSFDLVVLAMDDFKLVNKTYGIEMGDIMLRQVADFLSSVSRHGKVFRYGSDQFAVELRHEKRKNAEEELRGVLENIKERFRHPWIYNEESIHLSTTTVCISYPGDGDSLENLVEVLDYSVMYAKRQGRGAVVFTENVDLHAMRKEKAIEKAVEDALNNDTIEVHYQPIYNTEKQCYTSAEALVRMRDERLGNISPEIFIPIAERTGKIVKLGTMVFEKVCRFMHEQNIANSTIEYIEVNVSVVQCMREDFVETILSIMDRYDIRPEQINLEITETAEISELNILQENVERLHGEGITFSLDDYGSGYSTLGYIHQFPFHIIKLDKLMVWDAFETERARTTLKYTVGMIKELNMHIVAEGVETEQQQQKLSTLGCDYLQGWYYSKAIPPEKFAELIRKTN
ncbi:MAG: EAL domain-containing protein [Lachnospiraceae bacterium]|nr:EAL domain-containing protein [Lachnospiraceae bacterium]